MSASSLPVRLRRLKPNRPVVLLELLKNAQIQPAELLPYPSTSLNCLVPPIPAKYKDLPLCIHPPSPFIKRLRDLLFLYTCYFPMLDKLLPFLILWLRSHGITSVEISEAALTLMVIAYLRVHFDVPDLQIIFNDISSEPRWMERALCLKVDSSRLQARNGIGFQKLQMPPRHPLRYATMGKILHSFFRYVC